MQSGCLSTWVVGWGRVFLIALITFVAVGVVGKGPMLGGSNNRIFASEQAYLQPPCPPSVALAGAHVQITPTATATATATPDPCATPTLEPTVPPPPTPCPGAVNTTFASTRHADLTATPTATATATPTLDPCATPAFTPPSPATATSCPPVGAFTATATSTATSTFTPVPTATGSGTGLLPTLTPTPSATATPTSQFDPCAATVTPAVTVPATPTLVETATPTTIASPTTIAATATPTLNAAGGALFIFKDAPAVVAAATPITYTLRIQNNSATTLRGLNVYDQLPANAQYVADSGGALDRSGETPVVRWSVPGLAVGAQAVVSFSALASDIMVNDQYGVATQAGAVITGYSPVLTLVGGDVQQTIMTSESGGTLLSADTNVQITFLPNTTSQDVTVTLTKAATLLTRSGFAGLAFNIDAVDAQGQPVTQFEAPFQLVVHYQDADWQNAGIANEAFLNLYFWRNGVWEAILPCDSCSHDMVNNLIAVTLNHLTLFALRAEPHEIWLPLVRR